MDYCSGGEHCVLPFFFLCVKKDLLAVVERVPCFLSANSSTKAKVTPPKQTNKQKNNVFHLCDIVRSTFFDLMEIIFDKIFDDFY